MSLPVPNLDNRRFQDIVDEAKGLISHYCPEWTDHNVSDPGVALLELFAWMTDMLLYRVNQVPEKNYLKFLELLGIQLEPPRSARASITFYLSAPQPTATEIPQGTEVATMRTETSPAIIFTTEQRLVIQPPTILGAATRSMSGKQEKWIRHDLKRLTSSTGALPMFSNAPVPNDAFCLALEKDHSQHVLRLHIGCKEASATGVRPENPPLEWQVWQGPFVRWVNCTIEQDTTQGLNADGEIVLRLPQMVEEDLGGIRAYWLRCRVTELKPGQAPYQVSPVIERYLTLEAIGGTVGARHAIAVKNEVLGYSDGTPGQVFQILNVPVLSRDPATDYLIVEPPGNAAEQWKEVVDFGDSEGQDCHYVIDSLAGTIHFGPSLIQPDGSVYSFGTTPPRGSLLRLNRYQYGGGGNGNVPAKVIKVLKSAIPYIAQATNWEPAVGGRDPQSVEDAKLRAARFLRARTRAVTADDFEFHATQVAGIARARCLAPGEQPGDATDIPPGQVFVLALPQVETPEKPQPGQLVLSAEKRQEVLEYLRHRCVLGTAIEVRLPDVIWVSVRAELRLPEGIDPALRAETERMAYEKLYQYLNPYLGGLDGKGWPFGRSLHLSELFSLLQQLPHVEFVESIKVERSKPGSAVPAEPAPPRLALRRHELLCSAHHSIVIAQ